MEEKIKVQVIKGGPYVITEEFKLLLASGEEKNMTGKTFLCRCGASKNKPFCDGSHTKIEFDK